MRGRKAHAFVIYAEQALRRARKDALTLIELTAIHKACAGVKRMPELFMPK